MTQQNHGLINRALQRFVRDRYGADAWRAIAAEVGLVPPRFEPMLRYDVALTRRVLIAVQRLADQNRDDLLCSIGAYLGSHSHMAPLQRLLRFGSDNFEGFVQSLVDLPDRVQLAVPDLQLPRVEVTITQPGHMRLICVSTWPEYAHVLRGVLQAIGPMYGCKVTVQMVPVLLNGAQSELSRTDLLIDSCALPDGNARVMPFPGRIYRHGGHHYIAAQPHDISQRGMG